MGTSSIKLKGREYSIRLAGITDAAVIALHRQSVFVEHGRGRDDNLAAMADAFTVWLRRKLRERRYLGWLAEYDGTVVAGVGVLLVEWPPHPAHFGPLRGYVMNAYTERAHRGTGLDDYLLQLAAERPRPRAPAEPQPAAPSRHESLTFADAPEVVWS